MLTFGFRFLSFFPFSLKNLSCQFNRLIRRRYPRKFSLGELTGVQQIEKCLQELSSSFFVGLVSRGFIRILIR